MLLVSICILCSPAWGEQPTSEWQKEVRKSVEAQDWPAAMREVDREIARAPDDMDLRAWRARILTWSGSLADAEREYGEILVRVPNDPDCWVGLANVYSRQNRSEDELRALEHAVALDPKRADIRTAHARGLIAAHQPREAKIEFQKALQLDPSSSDGRAGLFSLRGPLKHELRVGADADFLNFTGANQGEGLSLTSQWTPQWKTHVAEMFYDRNGTRAVKFMTSLTGTASRWGSLTLGGATSDDNGVIPRAEAFFEADHGWKLAGKALPRGVEIVYGQHWYWYATARILTLNETTLFYLPHEWTWSLGVTGARSSFPEAGAEWRPSGTSRLGFPLSRSEKHPLEGNVFFAAGTENFAQLDQIGRFSAQTYGGGLRLHLTASQEVTGYTAYQKRTQDRTQTSLGFSYAKRF
jgi:tetratricopeptide (TPR) repeat protein